MPGGSTELAAEGLFLDRGEVRAIICQIPNGDLAALVLKQIDALRIHGGASALYPAPLIPDTGAGVQSLSRETRK